MEVLLWLLLLLLSGLFIGAGTAKALSFSDFSAQLLEYFPGVLRHETARLTALMLISSEVLLGFLLLTSRAEIGLVGALVLMVCFLVFILWRIQLEDQGTCSCFGAILPSRFDMLSLGRNMVLIVIILTAWFLAGEAAPLDGLMFESAPIELSIVSSLATVAAASTIRGGGERDAGTSRPMLEPGGVLNEDALSRLLKLRLREDEKNVPHESQEFLAVIVTQSCSHCIDLLESLEEQLKGISKMDDRSVVLIEGGEVVPSSLANRYHVVNYSSPETLLQDFPVTGTPAGVVLDDAGRIGQVLVGLPEVLNACLQRAKD